MSPRRGVLLERIDPAAVAEDIPQAPAAVDVGPDDTIDALLRAIRMSGSRAVRIHADDARRALGSQGRVRMLAYFLGEERFRAVLVTRDPRLQALARAEGIPVQDAAQTEAARRVARAGREPVFERLEPRQAPPPPALSLRLPDDRTLAALPLGRIGLLLIGGLAAYLAFAFFVQPSSTITVTPRAEFIPVELTVRVDPDAGAVDLENGIIPAEIVEVVVADTLSKPTSGRRREPESFAQGEVTLRNRTREAILVPRGTPVRTPDGVGFTSDVEVLVPPTLSVAGTPVPGEAIVPVTAERPGISGNVPGLAIVAVGGRFARTLDAFNARPLSGAGEREVALVAQRDVDELLRAHGERLQSAAVERLRRERPANQILVVWSPDSGNPEITRQEFSAQLDERAAVLSLDLALRARGTSFANADLERLLAHKLAAASPERQFNIDRVRITGTEVLDERFGVLVVRVRAVGEVVDAIDEADVRAALTGTNLDDGLAVLHRLPGVANFEVAHDPPDTANFPRLGFRIDVAVTAPQAEPPG